MKTQTRIGVLVAMDKELKLFIDNFYAEPETHYGYDFYQIHYSDDVELIVVKSGIGKVNATIATTLLMTIWNPDIVLTTGVCGSLDRDAINQGEIHIAETVQYHDVWCGEPNKLGQVQDMPVKFQLIDLLNDDHHKFIKAIKNRFKDRVGYLTTMLSGDWFVDTPEKAVAIKESYEKPLQVLLDVDMEIGAIAQVCHIFHKKLIAIKIVSDAILNLKCKKYSEFWETAGDVLYEVVIAVADNVHFLTEKK